MNNHPRDLLDEEFDVVIVGGGSSGAVMARRLSEDPRRRVLLIEAGPERAEGRAAEAVRGANQPAVLPGLNWKFHCAIKGDDGAGAARGDTGAGPQAVRGGVASSFDYEAGRLLGGSSAINAVQTLRGAPIDFDEWAALCGDDWNWAGVLPYFRKLEDDPLGPSELHGSGGPLPIRRETPAQLTTLQTGLLDACRAAGRDAVVDHNDPSRGGVGVIPKNVIDGERISVAQAYLDPVRDRANLHIVTDAFVTRLLWRSTALAAGVEVEAAGRTRAVLARHVVVCAGVMHTPCLLMRSGIGDAAQLAALGIETMHALPGVGVGLQDHPVVGIWGRPKPGIATLGEPLRQVLLRYSSQASGYENDMHICMMAGIDVKEMFPRLGDADAAPTIAGLTTCFNKSTSRGQVRMLSADPNVRPRISFNCLGDPGDVAPLVEGVRIAWSLINSPQLKPMFGDLLAWTEGMIRSDVALERAVSTFVRPSAHACGTVRMGLAPVGGAVVDPAGRVFGCDNLWVADASVMPMIPSVPPHLTCLMVAEKLADGLAAAV